MGKKGGWGLGLGKFVYYLRHKELGRYRSLFFRRLFCKRQDPQQRSPGSGDFPNPPR